MQTQTGWPRCGVTGMDAYLIKDNDEEFRCSACGELLLPASMGPSKGEASEAFVTPNAITEE
ncbi:MAG TPA: hypothetical protein VGR53_02940 [Nitrososphaerales archaeon]|nr:hypothetical protein [Nitrososphaerales archaeon]